MNKKHKLDRESPIVNFNQSEDIQVKKYFFAVISIQNLKCNSLLQNKLELEKLDVYFIYLFLRLICINT